MSDLSTPEVMKQIFTFFQHGIEPEREIKKPDFEANKQEIINAIYRAAEGKEINNGRN